LITVVVVIVVVYIMAGMLGVVTPVRWSRCTNSCST